ncbi:unnamed protein product [Euphydryas editha]|uniref:Uncharacterized protein n=1 Tax=Euphydryas editha TaxID=104508 RepID=A0AAU9TC80_EUPED|nr:unnamed protein product [Euphydryas editha]
MDREKHTVVKSKSSNNGIPLKAAKKNKKSLSNVDVTPNLMKKRGISDRRIFKSPLLAQEANLRRKPPPKPRPGQKKFLTSVLSILSKSTTGTQYPDVQEQTDTKYSKRTRTKYRHEADIKHENPNKQGKYKSRILNRKTNINDHFIVLQSTKEIVQTPSNYSEANVVNDVQNDRPIKVSIRDIINNNLSREITDVAKDGLEEKLKKEKKIRIKDEPETLASKLAEESDNKLYNLFVDILENTFNVYNLKEDRLSNSNTALEINESVAKKLTVNNKASNELACGTRKEITEEQKNIFDKPIDIKLSEHKTLKRIKPRVSINSFVQAKKIDIPETFSYHGKRKYIKNKRKNVLLSIFKEELKLKPTLEEPLTLYQALKIMAKSKKIKHDKRVTSGVFDKSECLLKRRKIINMKTKKDTKVDRDKIIQKYSDYNSKFKKREKPLLIPSHHSLEVYEYNYEEPEIPKSIQYINNKNNYQENENKNRKDTLSKSPSPFVMHSNYDYYTLLKFPDRSTYDFIY